MFFEAISAAQKSEEKHGFLKVNEVVVVLVEVVGQIISPFFAKDFFNVTKFTC